MPKVYNKYHKNAPSDAIYIGRPSKWGNPFSHNDGTLAKFKVESRDQAVDAYAGWVEENPNLLNEIKSELAGKDLLCFCAPKRCHGDILLAIANVGNDIASKSTSDVLKHLHMMHPDLLVAAVEKLAYERPTDATVEPYILKCLDNTDRLVRERIARALVAFPSKFVLAKLNEIAITDEDSVVRQVASETAKLIDATISMQIDDT